MKFRYTGQCDAGYVKFGDVVMPEGEAVEVPNWLSKKLANNSHFEAVAEEAAEAPRRGRKPKSDDAT